MKGLRLGTTLWLIMASIFCLWAEEQPAKQAVGVAPTLVGPPAPKSTSVKDLQKELLLGGKKPLPQLSSPEKIKIKNDSHSTLNKFVADTEKDMWEKDNYVMYIKTNFKRHPNTLQNLPSDAYPSPPRQPLA